MKKIIAVLIALAMVLSMSVMAFAEFAGILSPGELTDDSDMYDRAVSMSMEDLSEIPDLLKLRMDIREQGIYEKDDGSFMNWDESWSAYYKYIMENAQGDPMNAVKAIVSTITDGSLEPGDAISKIGEAIMGGVGGEGESGDLSGIISGIIDKIVGGDKEPEISTEDYVNELAELINGGAGFDEVTKKISDDIASGKIVLKQLPDIAKGISDLIDTGAIEDNETVQKILEFIKGLGGDGDSKFPSFGDIELPWDKGDSEGGSFLDTILGIIGSIGDIFNPTPDEPTNPIGPGDDNTTAPIPDTGDISFVAVAAVAAVAGAALVLTRKKNDAE